MAATAQNQRTQNGHARGGMADKGVARKGPAPGSRLAEAFEAVERVPVLVESRERGMKAATAATAPVGEIVDAGWIRGRPPLAGRRFRHRATRKSTRGPAPAPPPRRPLP